jgi:hypothetical protein
MEYYGKYFETTKEDVLLAEYRLNRDFTLCGYAALNDFYELLGLEKSESGEVLGWTLENSWSEVGEYPWVDFEHETVTMDDGLECCIITFTHPPTADYLSY